MKSAFVKASIGSLWLRWLVVVFVGLLLMWGAMFVFVPRNLFPDPYSTLVYSVEGELLGARIAGDGQWRFPPSDSLPDKFVKCLTTYEDKRFFYHIGIDPIAVARALRSNFRRGEVVSGGSTITMQLARVARGNRKRTLYQKAVEALWALHIETTHSKKEILNIYASHAPFGGNVVGVETAAWRYFGRGVHDLSWAESALLAVLPNSPSLIHPGRNRQSLKAKRDALLAKLCERGAIDMTVYELSCMEPLPEAPLPLPDRAPHLTERIAASAAGKRTSTSINASLQWRTQEIVDRYGRDYASNHVHNLAAIIADVRTGEVIAYAGNVSFGMNESGGGAQSGRSADLRSGANSAAALESVGAIDSKCRSVDIITAPRSTGSILKPILYAGMLQDGMILPASLVSDVPLNINGFAPHNFNKQFYGAVPARRAIERSLNVPLVRMLGRYNTGRFMELLKRCGMTTLCFTEEHYGASLILGGAEGTLWDMTGMYASLARTLSHFTACNGRYDPADIHPLTLLHSDDRSPATSADDSRLTDKPLLSASSIWFAFEAMSGLNRPEEEADWQQFRSMKQIAWKTGTSYGSRDGWAIGVTPRYAVGVWVGNASGEGRAGLTGVSYAAPVLFELFSMLPGGGWFRMPYEDMERIAVCRRSGCKASSICDAVDSLYVPRRGVETQLCPYHRLVHLSADGRWQVNSSCEDVAKIATRPWFVLPPAQEYYYRNYNADYQPLPPYKPGCVQPQSRAMEIIYPNYNDVLFLPKGFTGEREKFVFRAAHADREAAVYWYVDEEFLGMTQTHHNMAMDIDAGKHLLTLTDEKGNTIRRMFTVR